MHHRSRRAIFMPRSDPGDSLAGTDRAVSVAEFTAATRGSRLDRYGFQPVVERIQSETDAFVLPEFASLASHGTPSSTHGSRDASKARNAERDAASQEEASACLRDSLKEGLGECGSDFADDSEPREDEEPLEPLYGTATDDREGMGSPVFPSWMYETSDSRTSTPSAEFFPGTSPHRRGSAEPMRRGGRRGSLLLESLTVTTTTPPEEEAVDPSNMRGQLMKCDQILEQQIVRATPRYSLFH
jgi:hypothetical protein